MLKLLQAPFTVPNQVLNLTLTMFSRTVLHTTTRVASPLRLTLNHHASRTLSTLPSNPHIHVFPHPLKPSSHLLTLLPTEPPNVDLALGATTSIPATPSSFTPNPHFTPILTSVLAEHAAHDPSVQQQAAAFASSGGANTFTTHARSRSGGDGAGGASHSGGAGGGNKGGWIHVSDDRNPPDWGRIAWPEDIFGSVEVDGEGKVVGNWQESGTYRMVTREGM